MGSIDFSSTDHVAKIEIRNPDQRNALTDQVLGELAQAFCVADNDADVRCILVAGTAKVFASGADIRALLQRTPTEILFGQRWSAWEKIRRARTPIVAAVSGFCLGGGCELAMMADIVVASETARFGLPETQLGLIPGAGGTQMLPRAIGKAKAMDVILTGRLLDASEAERVGLVSRVVAAQTWQTDAMDVAQQIAARPAVAQRLAKEAVKSADEGSLSAGLLLERQSFGVAFGTDDATEGLTAFLEKRQPRWRHC